MQKNLHFWRRFIEIHRLSLTPLIVELFGYWSMPVSSSKSSASFGRGNSSGGLVNQQHQLSAACHLQQLISTGNNLLPFHFPLVPIVL